MYVTKRAILLLLLCLVFATPALAQDNPPVAACGLPHSGTIYQSASYTLTSHCERSASLVIDNGAHVTIRHNGHSFRIGIGDGTVTTVTAAGISTLRTSGVIDYVAGQQVDVNDCSRMLGGIGSICLVTAPVRALEVWGTGHEERGNYLFRVTQAQVDAVAAGGFVAASADGRVAMRVEHDGHVTLSMGPDAEDKVHHLTLEHTLSGRIIGTAVTYGTVDTGTGMTEERDEEDTAVASRVTPQPAQEDGSLIHVVRRGDTLGAIARAYDVPMQRIIDLNGIVNRSLIIVGQRLLIQEGPPGVPGHCRLYEPVVHVVQGDENISHVAGLYEMEPDTLAIRNDLPWSVRPLRVGRELTIPDRWTRDGEAASLPAECAAAGPVIHVVRAGQSLAAIALAYGVEPSAIIERNRLRAGGRGLVRGQRLVIQDAPAMAAEAGDDADPTEEESSAGA